MTVKKLSRKQRKLVSRKALRVAEAEALVDSIEEKFTSALLDVAMTPKDENIPERVANGAIVYRKMYRAQIRRARKLEAEYRELCKSLGVCTCGEVHSADDEGGSLSGIGDLIVSALKEIREEARAEAARKDEKVTDEKATDEVKITLTPVFATDMPE